MKAVLERIKAFFVLGSLHLSNKFRMVVDQSRIKAVEKEIFQLMGVVGREGWESGTFDASNFPSGERLQEFEGLLKEKEAAIAKMDQEVLELDEKKKRQLSYYEARLLNQTQLKEPVDNELSDLLVEQKRLRKELKQTRQEIITLEGKLTIQKERKNDFTEGDEESLQYLRHEVETEIDLNNKFIELKVENLVVLERSIARISQRADKVKRVADQYEQQIYELKSGHKEIQNNLQTSIGKLNGMKAATRGQIKRINEGMTPVLQELGGEITSRRVASRQFVEQYEKLDEIQSRKDLLVENYQRLVRECRSISFALKSGFYILLIFVLLGIIYLIF
jgi:chromosome segregation ATPase